jgi:hypothetical protein
LRCHSFVRPIIPIGAPTFTLFFLLQLYREFYQFGDDELTKLIKEAEKQKEQLCDVGGSMHLSSRMKNYVERK